MFLDIALIFLIFHFSPWSSCPCNCVYHTYQWCNPRFVLIGIASIFIFMFIKTWGINTGQVWTTSQSADCRQWTRDNGEEVAEGFLFSFSSKHAQHPCFLPPPSDKPCHRSQDPQWKRKLATKGHKHGYTRLSTASVRNPRGRTRHWVLGGQPNTWDAVCNSLYHNGVYRVDTDYRHISRLREPSVVWQWDTINNRR